MRLILLLIILLTACASFAQTSRLVIDENFTGYTDGNLNTTSSGQGDWHASFTNNGSDFVQVDNSAPLMYPNYTSGTNYVRVQQKADYYTGSWDYPDDPYKTFKNGEITINSTSTTFYISFLVRVSPTDAIGSMDDARPNAALRNLNGSQFANFYIAKSADGTKLKFGVNKDAYANGTYASADYNFNTSYLVVIRYDIENGQTTADFDDKVYLWINPSLSSQPSVSTAQVAIDNFWDFNYDGGFNTLAQSLQLFQEQHSASASFDAFKVAFAQGFSSDDADAAAAWDALSPAGVPLLIPLKSHLDGYLQKGKIILNWDVENEVNVQQYTIERSDNGTGFVSIGDVQSKNSGATSYYTFSDNAPLAGNNYYRIKNVFADGTVSYSAVIKISVKENPSLSFSVYPNPVIDSRITLRGQGQQSGIHFIEIFNAGGQRVLKKQITLADGVINESVQLPNTLRRGIYIIALTGSDLRQVREFLVQ
ncbi:MAG: T9SS type A sorting domain-containing protein [Chitinophagaceae bacterium]